METSIAVKHTSQSITEIPVKLHSTRANVILIIYKMLKVKSKREPSNIKRNKSIGKKTKKRLPHRVDPTSMKSRGIKCLYFEKKNPFCLHLRIQFSVKGKKHRIQSPDPVKQSDSCTDQAMQSMTAYEYYVQCRKNTEELRNKQIDSQMRGPISKKRMKALQALKKCPLTSVKNRSE